MATTNDFSAEILARLEKIKNELGGVPPSIPLPSSTTGEDVVDIVNAPTSHFLKEMEKNIARFKEASGIFPPATSPTRRKKKKSKGRRSLEREKRVGKSWVSTRGKRKGV